MASSVVEVLKVADQREEAADSAMMKKVVIEEVAEAVEEAAVAVEAEEAREEGSLITPVSMRTCSSIGIRPELRISVSHSTFHLKF